MTPQILNRSSHAEIGELGIYILAINSIVTSSNVVIVSQIMTRHQLAEERAAEGRYVYTYTGIHCKHIHVLVGALQNAVYMHILYMHLLTNITLLLYVHATSECRYMYSVLTTSAM